MARESEPEPTSLIALLRDAHWEIKSLLHEMEEILDLPTAVYELYPRIRLALEAHETGEKFALYGPMRDIPELRDLLRNGERAHAEIDRILDTLDRLPFRKEQVHSAAWKQSFRDLHIAVLAHVAEEEANMFPRLEALLAEARLDALGERYKRGLKGDLGPLPPSVEVNDHVIPS